MAIDRELCFWLSENTGPSSASNIDMDIFVRVPDNELVVESNSYDVGVSVIVNDVETNATQSFTAAAIDETTDVSIAPA